MKNREGKRVPFKSTLKEKAPWLTRDGKPRNKLNLYFLSRNWQRETWEAYLDSITVPRRERLMDRDDISVCEVVMEASPDPASETSEQSKRVKQREDLVFALKNALYHLSPQQKKIIYGRYYRGNSKAQMAREVGISEWRASKIERDALTKLKQLLGRSHPVGSATFWKNNGSANGTPELSQVNQRPGRDRQTYNLGKGEGREAKSNSESFLSP